MSDKTFSWNRTRRISSSTEKSDETKSTRRKDWGYTDQYRRMMQRDSRRKSTSETE
ncbi:hypothetical protein ACXYMT_14435 [Salinimicrobium sp. CAU 1759]